MIKYILLDLDGTITNPKEGITKAIQYGLAHMGIEVEDLDYMEKFIGPPLRASFMEYLGEDEEKIEQAVLYYREYFTKTGMFQNILYSGMEEMFANLVKAGKQLIVATSKPELFARQIIDYFGLTGYFTDVCGGSFDVSRENKGDVIRYALDKNHITDLDQVVMVGDRFHDIVGANENGIASVGVLYGFGNREELTDAGADYIAETVGVLSTILMDL